MMSGTKHGKDQIGKRIGWIPNALTASRILLSFLLPFLAPVQTAFLLVYAFCGVTDALDGFIARKTHSQSKLGARLDSLADFVMIVSVIISLYPIIHVPYGAVVWILAIAVIRIAAATVSWVKHKVFASLHTYTNKLTGLLIFLFPFLIPFFQTAAPIWIICAAATVSAVEELLIQVSSKTLNLDRKSVLSK